MVISLRSVPFLASRSRAVGLPLIDSFDDMESYVPGASVVGLNGGTGGWTSAYAASFSAIGFGATDDMESYTVGAAVNGLNGGQSFFLSWGGPYVDR